MIQKIKDMEEVIKKWELILQQDSGRDITYGRKVLEEMLTDVKQVVKNSFCEYCHGEGYIKKFSDEDEYYKCPYC